MTSKGIQESTMKHLNIDHEVTKTVYKKLKHPTKLSTNPDTQTISIRWRIQLSLYTSAAVTRGDKIGGSDTMGDTSGCIIL